MYKTDWREFKEGVVTTYNYRLDRVQVLIEGQYYISNLVDHLISKDNETIYEIDKIVLLGKGKPIAIYPYNAENIEDVYVYLESIKNTDIDKVLISVAENCNVNVDTESIEWTLKDIKSVAKMKVRYILNE